MSNAAPVNTAPSAPAFNDPDWWRHAVVYQVYPRSFADANNDGTGDVRGIISKLPYLSELGIDAIWVSPWYPSPLLDGGYDVADYCDISPDFGTLADAEELIEKAHALGIRVLIDLVPNHSSWDHPLFKAALAAGPGSPERDLYIFRDGKGENGELPPNNWGSLFGGPAWTRTTNADGTPGQWYLHMFDISQPDWNWEHPQVLELFDNVLRFWFDRGVDGFRIDVADSMTKDQALPDVRLSPETGFGANDKHVGSPNWDYPGLADIQRRWRRIADEYAGTPLGGRVFVAEAYLSPVERLVEYVRPDRLHTTFNFDALLSEWSAGSQRAVIDHTLPAHESVGAPATWVLGNHDNTRVVTRYGKAITGVDFTRRAEHEDESVEPLDLSAQLHEMPTDVPLGRRRARAAALLELALPGGAYVYQGEELGLDEVEDIPEALLQDPTWERSGHRRRGRDGCRVPLPWSGDAAPFGFGTDAEAWLPQPAHWAEATAAKQDADPASTLNLYRAALRLRRARTDFRDGVLAWHALNEGDVLAFTRGETLVVVNFGASPVALPAGEVLLTSAPLVDGQLPTDASAWIALA
ncbi:MAG: glycoside hydrolase family 13 protein [Propioniciclava sp.]|uniref:glycoside hydrolase family 13 protein n=1 Tax=Propioniciclava sp. TaxID=2038686 RepID=UPI0039E25A30